MNRLKKERFTQYDLNNIMNHLPRLKKGYHWRLDKNFIYGEYHLYIVDDEHFGVAIVLPSVRLNTREMYYYMQALIFDRDRIENYLV